MPSSSGARSPARPDVPSCGTETVSRSATCCRPTPERNVVLWSWRTHHRYHEEVPAEARAAAPHARVVVVRDRRTARSLRRPARPGPAAEPGPRRGPAFLPDGSRTLGRCLLDGHLGVRHRRGGGRGTAVFGVAAAVADPERPVRAGVRHPDRPRGARLGQPRPVRDRALHPRASASSSSWPATRSTSPSCPATRSNRGITGWLVSLVLGLGVGVVLLLSGYVISSLLVGLSLTTTAIGTLLPMLRDRDMLESPFGKFLVAAGTAGRVRPGAGRDRAARRGQPRDRAPPPRRCSWSSPSGGLRGLPAPAAPRRRDDAAPPRDLQPAAGADRACCSSPVSS